MTLDPMLVASLYVGGATMKEIAAQFGLSVQPIKRILRESGVSKRTAARRRGLFSGEKNSAWKGGRRTRRDKYVIVWTPEGDRLEHRLVMSRHLGRELLDSEVVHHKDENPSNNQIENLEILSQRAHSLQHGAANRAVLLKGGLKLCPVCMLVKPTGEFYATRHNKMGIQSWCKSCKNRLDAERRRKRKLVGSV